jgi:uncharacterized protein YndB with AHSA1/START domain
LEELNMSKSEFVYVTYIRSTIDKVWQALTTPEFTRQYWFGVESRSTFTKGAKWELVAPDGRVFDRGEILESDPPRRMVIAWQHQLVEEMRAEGVSRATFELEMVDNSVKLTVVHGIDVPNSKLVQGVSNGWPRILASLKSLLETGKALERTDRLPG